MTVILEREIKPADITNLLEARETIGLTQTELAERADLSQSYVALIETGKRALTKGVRARMAKTLEAARLERLEARKKIEEVVDSLPALTPEQRRMLQ